MGLYVNVNSKGEQLGWKKLDALIADGAEKIDPPTEWREGLVCVADNGFMDAAAYAYNEQEMTYFRENPGDRPVQWLQYSHAKELAK
jgi:hypothetical protein